MALPIYLLSTQVEESIVVLLHISGLLIPKYAKV